MKNTPPHLFKEKINLKEIPLTFPGIEKWGKSVLSVFKKNANRQTKIMHVIYICI